MKKITNRGKNMDNYVKNIYIVTSSDKNDILYKVIYIDFHKFELQIIKKKELTYLPRFAYFQILNYLTIEPNNESNINYSIELIDYNINLIFQNKIFENIYDLKWKIENRTLHIDLNSKNGEDISSSIKLLLLKKEKYDIQNINMINNSYSCTINTKFKLEKIPSIPSISKQLIPKVIMQTYKTSDVRNEIYNSTISWLICNPEYKYDFYDDERCILFIQKYFPKEVLDAFNNLIPGAYKADLFRYCYLYICGGVYTDIDNICMCNLKNIINDDDIFISVKDRPNACIYNAFIASTPKNPIFKNAIDNILHNVKYKIYPSNITKNYNDRYLAITGPLCLGKSLNLYLNRSLAHNFNEGDSIINNMKFKLFYLHKSGKYVTYNNKLIFFIKYNGYNTTSNYIKMFDNNTVYKSKPLV